MQVSEWVLIIQTTILLITLFILIRQTKENIKSTKASQYQNALNMMFEWRSDAINNPKLAEHYRSSIYFDEIFNKYGTEVFFHTIKLFHTLEVFYLLKEQKVIDKEMWEGWENNIKNLMTTKLNHELWSELKKIKIYHRGFVTAVDGLIPDLDCGT